ATAAPLVLPAASRANTVYVYAVRGSRPTSSTLFALTSTGTPSSGLAAGASPYVRLTMTLAASAGVCQDNRTRWIPVSPTVRLVTRSGGVVSATGAKVTVTVLRVFFFIRKVLGEMPTVGSVELTRY